jgi:hypothetical protein
MHNSLEPLLALMVLVAFSGAALSIRSLAARHKARESERAWKIVEKYIV